jgi:hypothetical protein
MSQQMDGRVREDMREELYKLEELVPDIIGLCTVVVRKDGSVKSYSGYLPGGRLILLAGLSLATSDLIKAIQDTPDGVCTCED